MDGKAWLVVGGRTRLGRAVAEALVETGPLVLTSSVTWQAESGWVAECSKRHPVRTLHWNADDLELASRMNADLERLQGEGLELGHALVVAGTFPRQPLGSWDPAALAETWRRNLSFPFLAAQAIAPRLADGGSLQLVLDTAIHRPLGQRLPYTAAKAGLASLVAGLAVALAPRVRVAGHALGTLLPDAASDPEALAAATPLRRIGNPADLVRAIRYVADSSHLTGEILTLDGGRRWV